MRSLLHPEQPQYWKGNKQFNAVDSRMAANWCVSLNITFLYKMVYGKFSMTSYSAVVNLRAQVCLITSTSSRELIIPHYSRELIYHIFVIQVQKEQEFSQFLLENIQSDLKLARQR